MTKWKDLKPDEEFLKALEQAGPRPADTAEQNPKKNWSKALADSCAVMLANALRNTSEFSQFDVFPTPDGQNTEFKIRTRGKRPKSVDVAVTTRAAGLQFALTLKGSNFPDRVSGYAKNFTGRIYELNEEVPLLHEYYPHAHVVCIYFLPLDSTKDKVERSSFPFLVEKLRAITGRADMLNITQFKKLDWSVVALYVPTDLEDGTRRGVCRYFDVDTKPPKLGRPQLKNMITLDGLCERLASMFSGEGEIEYDPPEEE